MMIFSQDVVHRGIKNTSSENRYVFFTVIGPKDQSHTDKYQHFEWTWYEDLYGFRSSEHLKSLESNKIYNPLKHEKKHNRKILNDALQYNKKKRQKLDI